MEAPETAMLNDRDIMNVRGVAKLLMLGEETVRCMAREGRIPAFKIGRAWRFNRNALHEWAQEQRKSQSKKSVLIIDDEERDLELVGLAVEKAGFRAVAASSGAKALEIMRQDLPDVVLLDLKMSGMDGPTVLREVRKIYGFIPAILITGYPDSGLVAQALEHGPVTLLSKPVGFKRLLSAIRMATNGGAVTPASTEGR